jgi:hypothetical protein
MDESWEMGVHMFEEEYEGYEEILELTLGGPIPPGYRSRLNSALRIIDRRGALFESRYPLWEKLPELFHETFGPFFKSLSPQWRAYFIYDVLSSGFQCLREDPFKGLDKLTADCRAVLKHLRVELKQTRWLLDNPRLRPQAMDHGQTLLPYSLHYSVFESSLENEKRSMMGPMDISEDDLLKRKIEGLEKRIKFLLPQKDQDARGGTKFRTNLMELKSAIRPSEQYLRNHKIVVWDPHLVHLPNKKGIYTFSFEKAAVNVLLLCGASKTENNLIEHLKKARAQRIRGESRMQRYAMPYEKWIAGEEERTYWEDQRQQAQAEVEEEEERKKADLEDELGQYLAGW